MGIPLQRIIKGLIHKVGRKSSKNRFPKLSWVREKILKHQDDKKIKLLEVGKIKFSYRLPYSIFNIKKFHEATLGVIITKKLSVAQPNFKNR